MNRNQTIDFLRGFCMFYIVGIFHLTQYLGESYYLNNNIHGNSLMWSCLGTFSLISGYLLGLKYKCESIHDIFFFYKKRIVRFYPLFLLSSLCLFIIGFNDLPQTMYSILGIAPFVSHKPKTLWYISMIMIFYLISPIVLTSRKKRIIFSMVILVFFSILSRIIYVDLRFLYNLMLYLLGVCAASFKFDWLKKASYYKWGGVIGSLLLYFALYCKLATESGFLYRMVTNVSGVFALLSFAYLVKKIMPSNSKLIYFFSYSSMSCYLFHRFTYWLCLTLYNPNDLLVKSLFLFLFAFPIGLAFAYYIQKLYDTILLRNKKGKQN